MAEKHREHAAHTAKAAHKPPEESEEDAALRAENSGQDSFTPEQQEEHGSYATEFVTPRGSTAKAEASRSVEPPEGPADQSSQGGTLTGTAGGVAGTETSSAPVAPTN